jgi:hypothetical protein
MLILKKCLKNFPPSEIAANNDLLKPFGKAKCS